MSNGMTTTPVEVNDEVSDFCLKLDAEQQPMFVPVHPRLNSREDDCFINVQNVVSKRGGRAQQGWTIWETPNVLLEAEFHAVWVKRDGDYEDVTPKSDDEEKILFLPTNNTEYKEEVIPNRFFPLTRPYPKRVICAPFSHFEEDLHIG